MVNSQTASAGTADAAQVPKPRPASPAPADEAASAEVLITEQEVLITEQEVLFGTAAAVPARRHGFSGRFVALMKRMLAVVAEAAGPPRPTVPKRYEFLERALMAREMDRL